MSNIESTEPLIETPVSLLPDLTEYGIVEVDKGICEDTFENRQILRANKIKWQALYNSEGAPTNKIMGISSEMQEAQVLHKGTLLEDPRDVNSDYLTGYSLILDDKASGMVPAWVLGATYKWNKLEDEREKTGEKKWPHLASAPGRCNAKRIDGRRCANWHSGAEKDGGFCRIHINQLAAQPNILMAARNRLHSAALAAINELENSLEATSEPVRLKAATEILDRVGIRAGFEIDQKVEVQTKPTATLVAERLNKLKAVAAASEAPDEDIVDAVVVNEETTDEQ